MSSSNLSNAADQEHMFASEKMRRRARDEIFTDSNVYYFEKYRKGESSISRIYDIHLVEEQDGTGVGVVCDDGWEYRFAARDDIVSSYDTPEKLMQAIREYAGQNEPERTLEYAGTCGLPYCKSSVVALKYIRELEERYDADIVIGSDMEFDEYQQSYRRNNLQVNVYLPLSVAGKMASDASVAEKYEASIEKLERCPDREDKDTKSMVLKTVGLQILENGDENFWHHEWREEAVRAATVEFVLPSDGEESVNLYLVDKEEEAQPFIPFDYAYQYHNQLQNVRSKNPSFAKCHHPIHMMIDKQTVSGYSEIGALFEPWQPYIFYVIVDEYQEPGDTYRIVINDYFLDSYIGLEFNGKVWKTRVHDKLG